MRVTVETLAEVANAYFARAKEIEALLHKAEREGTVLKGSNAYKFRTGELRSYIELFARSWELGSRRITMAKAADEGPG